MENISFTYDEYEDEKRLKKQRIVRNEFERYGKQVKQQTTIIRYIS